MPNNKIKRETCKKILNQYNNDSDSKEYLGAFISKEYNDGSFDITLIYLPKFIELVKAPIYSSIKAEDGVFMTDIRYAGPLTFMELLNIGEFEITEKYKKVFKNYINKAIDCSTNFVDTKLFYEGLEKICRLRDGDTNISDSSNAEAFLNSLTKIQNHALESIFIEIGREGNISLSTLIKEYGYSRPVYDGLLSKIRQYNVAKVVSQGVKGTYIKFTDETLKEKAEDYI